MNYIVLDMEWNQPWPGSPSARKVLPVQIRGEIIQIGAVRVTEDQQVADEFQVLIKPKYYRHLNRRVSKLTGIKESRLKAEGVHVWVELDFVRIVKSPQRQNRNENEQEDVPVKIVVVYLFDKFENSVRAFVFLF